MSQDFPGCPVVKTASIAGGMSSIPGQGTKILFPHSVANKK